MSSAAEACGKPYNLNMGGTANVGQLNMKEPYPVPKFISLGQVGQYQCLYDDSPDPGPDPPWFTLGPSLAWESSNAAYLPNVINLDRYITSAGNMSDILGSQGAELDDTLVAGEAVFNAGHPGDTWSDFLTRAQSKVSWLWGSLRDGGCGIVKVSPTQVKFIGAYGVYNNEAGTDERIAATQTNSPFNIADIQNTCLCVYYDKERGTFADAISVIYPIGSEVTYVTNPTTFITSPGNIIYGLNYGSLSDVIDNSVVDFGDGHVPNTCIQVGSVASPYGGGPYDIFWPNTVIDVPGYAQTWGSADTGLGENQYERGDGTGDNDGEGDYNVDSDDIDGVGDDMFTVDAQSCGFVTVYEPDKATLQSFASWLYGTVPTTYESFLDQIKKLQLNPMNGIISLNISHFGAATTGAEPLGFYGQDSGISAPVVTKLTHVKDCGSVDINETISGWLSYNDNVKLKAYLPYCGTFDLSTNWIMGRGKITLKYVIDVLTGACVAELEFKRDKRFGIGEEDSYSAPMYRFTGNVFQQVPISAVDYSGIIQGQLGLAAAAGSFASGNMIGGLSGAYNSMTAHPSVSTIGSPGASYGYMSDQTPYLIYEFPCYNMPDSYENYYGQPIYDFKNIGSCKGLIFIDGDTFWSSDVDRGDFIDITSEEEELLKQAVSEGLYMPRTIEDNNRKNYDPTA